MIYINKIFKGLSYYVLWLIFWSFTPGLIGLDYGIGALFSNQDSIITLINSILILVVMGILLWKVNDSKSFYLNRLGKKSIIILLSLLVISLATLPLHYHMELPIVVYIVWMLSSVMWQNYITFGLLYKYLEKTFRANKIVDFLMPFIFLSGHIIFIPDRFGINNMIGIISILLTGIILTVLRKYTGNISWQTAIHLLFYYIFS